MEQKLKIPPSQVHSPIQFHKEPLMVEASEALIQAPGSFCLQRGKSYNFKKCLVPNHPQKIKPLYVQEAMDVPNAMQEHTASTLDL